MNTMTPKSIRIMPALGRRLLTAPTCRASHCAAAAAVSRSAACRGSGVPVSTSDRSASAYSAVSVPGHRPLHTSAATAAFATSKPRDGRRSLHATARNLTVDPVAHGPKGLLPEFSLKDKVIVVSGGAQGLGLVQTEALLKAGATGRL